MTDILIVAARGTDAVNDLVLARRADLELAGKLCKIDRFEGFTIGFNVCNNLPRQRVQFLPAAAAMCTCTIQTHNQFFSCCYSLQHGIKNFRVTRKVYSQVQGVVTTNTSVEPFATEIKVFDR